MESPLTFVVVCYTTKPWRCGSQLPGRLEPEVEEKLERVAARIGTSKSALIRLVARTFVEQMVKPDGAVGLPPQWSSVLPAADKRSAATQPVPRVQQSPEALVKATRSVKANTRKEKRERLRPLRERLEQMKEANGRLEAPMKAANAASDK
jgi:hypothetical protein